MQGNARWLGKIVVACRAVPLQTPRPGNIIHQVDNPEELVASLLLSVFNPFLFYTFCTTVQIHNFNFGTQTNSRKPFFKWAE